MVCTGVVIAMRSGGRPDGGSHGDLLVLLVGTSDVLEQQAEAADRPGFFAVGAVDGCLDRQPRVVTGGPPRFGQDPGPQRSAAARRETGCQRSR